MDTPVTVSRIRLMLVMIQRMRECNWVVVVVELVAVWAVLKGALSAVASS